MDTVLVERRHGVVWLTLDRPEKKNALTPEMFLEMREAINSAQSNAAIRCLILTGRSGVFTAGDDVGDAGAVHAGPMCASWRDNSSARTISWQPVHARHSPRAWCSSTGQVASRS